MKKLIIIIILSTLILSSCTQQMTDEEILQRAEEIQAEQTTATPEVTAEPTATTIPEYELEDFDVVYAALRDNPYVEQEHWDMLQEMYDTYGIVLKFDASFGSYSFESMFDPLDEALYDNAISLSYKALKRLNPTNSQITADFINFYLNEIYCSDTFDKEEGTNKASAGRSGSDSIIMAYKVQGMYADDGNLSTKKSTGNIISELSNILIRKNKEELSDLLAEFSSYNEEVVGNDLWNYGFLDWESVDNQTDDIAEYMSGIITNYNEFWEAYLTCYFQDDNQTSFHKGNLAIEILGILNPEYTPEFLFENYCPYATVTMDGIQHNVWDELSPYFED